MRGTDVLFWIVMALIVGGVIVLVLTDSSGSVMGMDNSRFADMLYLGIWGVVLAALFVGSRFRRAHMLRNFAIWLLILVILIGAYRYLPIAEWLGRTIHIPLSRDAIKI